ncbi:MAG: hypothetical protein A2Y12_19960 [Planctomycetes bacterium GWF2_42_9]|nr:MAG: hypothetical protein A2Y12_19960 [Planctomycetes bacterium GWF2_42_9]
MRYEKMSKYFTQSADDYGLPCFVSNLDSNPNSYYPFNHLISTGRISALLDQWGTVKCFTTEGGYTMLNPISPRLESRSSLYFMMKIGDDLYSLINGELESPKQFTYGVGYGTYTGQLKTKTYNLEISQTFIAEPSKQPRIDGFLKICNKSKELLNAELFLCSDAKLVCSGRTDAHLIFTGENFCGFSLPGNELHNIFLVADSSCENCSSQRTLRMKKTIQIKPGEEIEICCRVGYGLKVDDNKNLHSQDNIHNAWKLLLERVQIKAPQSWMQHEAKWCMGQLLSFLSYDSYLEEYFIAIGGYGSCGFPVREACETAICLAYWYPDLAKSSLRWVAKTQLINGDIPKNHNFTNYRDISSYEFESDNEIWFILGCCEYVAITGDTGIFLEEIKYWDLKAISSMWKHIKKAFYWIRDNIGVGRNGLILIRDGDWNDYLSLIGAGGRGESVMNSEMACRAFSLLEKYAVELNEYDFAKEVKEFCDGLQTAVQKCFDKAWFVRGYTDQGFAVGFKEDRLFLNAQTWAVLGRCGTDMQRQQSIVSAVQKCGTSIGLMLMSKPYSSPPPEDISFCPLPSGDGENAGIWPQTAHWAVWALAEQGMTDLAIEQWEAMSLHNHAKLFPDVPFGIFNSPDCFSSKFAGDRHGLTQVELINRAVFVPMNPGIAWQAFSLKKIEECQKSVSGKIHSTGEIK